MGSFFFGFPKTTSQKEVHHWEKHSISFGNQLHRAWKAREAREAWLAKCQSRKRWDLLIQRCSGSKRKPIWWLRSRTCSERLALALKSPIWRVRDVSTVHVCHGHSVWTGLSSRVLGAAPCLYVLQWNPHAHAKIMARVKTGQERCGSATCMAMGDYVDVAALRGASWCLFDLLIGGYPPSF